MRRLIITIVIILVWVLLATFQIMTAKGDDRFGVATHFDMSQIGGMTGPAPQYNIKRMAEIKSLGIDWVRDNINMSAYSDANGNFLFPTNGHQIWVDAVYAAGLKLVGCLAISPFTPDPWDPTKVANFCVQLAQYEGTKLAAIEVVNEAQNITEFQGAAGQQKLVALTNAIDSAVHSRVPTWQGAVIGLDEQGSQVLNMLGMSPNQDIGLVYHPYDNNSAIPEDVWELDQTISPNKDGYLNWLKLIAGAMQSHGLNLKSWETEWSLTPQGRGEYCPANYVARRVLLSLGSGVAHTFFYNFIDNGDQSLDSYQGDLRQAGFVYTRMITALSGVLGVGVSCPNVPNSNGVTVTSYNSAFDALNAHSALFEAPDNRMKTVVGVWRGNSATTWENDFGFPPDALPIVQVSVRFPLSNPAWTDASASLLNPITGEVSSLKNSSVSGGIMTVSGVPFGCVPSIIVVEPGSRSGHHWWSGHHVGINFSDPE